MEQIDRKKNSTVFLILCLVSIIIVMGGVLLYLLLYKDTQQEAKQTKKNELKEIYLPETVANELISYVPVANPLQFTDYGFLDKKVTVSEMDLNHLTYNAMQKINNKGKCTEEQFNLNDICDWTFKVKDVKESMENLYGDLAIVELPKQVKNNFLYYCTRDENEYACSNSGGGTTSAGPVWDYFVFGNHNVTKYQKAEKDENNLYLYVKFARIEVNAPVEGTPADKAEHYSFKVYKYGNGTDLISDTVNGKEYCDNDTYMYNPCDSISGKTLSEKVYDQFKDKMTTYKIIYHIDERENYTLSSVEPLK